MKQVRMMRISLFICAAVAAAGFWTGFYFGNTGVDSAEMVTENTTDIYERNSAASEEESDTDRVLAVEDTADTESVESMTNLSPETYYLKANGSFLSVYRGDSGEVYFDTGIRLSDLPADLRESAAEGIAFDNLEELYGFLENYSS